MRFFRQFYEQMRAIYQGMSRPRRISLLAMTGVCLAVLVGLGVWIFQTDYQVLYSGLSPEDAGVITAKLQAQSVPFRLNANGATILVPAERVSQLRVDFAAEGVPSKGKGFEIFDEMNVGMTPFLQHVNLDRALQAELAKTIVQVEPIVHARVHLVRPEQTPFVREQKPATASVVLKLKPGAVLSRSTAQGIVALVSRSVEGLNPEQVTLVDTSGRLLSENKGDTPGPVASQMEYRRELETYLSHRAEDMLAQVLGPGRAVVRVTAEVNFLHQKTKKESYDPEQRVLVKETITNRKSATGGQAVKPGAGASSNLPNKTPPTASSGHQSNDNEENTDSEWRATKIEQEMEEGRGNIERLTVAALLDLSKPEGAAGAGLVVADAEEIIKQAVGFKKGRDEIKVSDLKLASGTSLETVEAEYQESQRMRWYLSLARNVSLGVTALVAMLMGWMYLRRSRPKDQAPPPAAETPVQDDELLAGLLAEDPQRLAKVLERWLSEAETPARQPAARAAA